MNGKNIFVDLYGICKFVGSHIFYPEKQLFANYPDADIIRIMEEREITMDNYKTLTFFTIFWVILGWLGFISTLLSFFHLWIFVAYAVIAVSVFVYYLLVKKIVPRPDRELMRLSTIILAVVIFFSLFVTPTIFSGRDQGAISEAAIRLAQNHRLEFSTAASKEFFSIYSAPKQKMDDCVNNLSGNYDRNFLTSAVISAWCGANSSGKALNFPGFHYTPAGSLTTQFPLAYISWLAIFYGLFGIGGLVVANAILLFLFLTSFYFLFRLFSEKKYAALLLILAITSFSFSWFFKFTLSENMALALLWISILNLALLLKKPQNIFYFSYLLSSFLLVFARIEGILFLAAGIILLFISSNSRNYIKAKLPARAIMPLIILGGMFLWNLTKDSYFYKEIIKALTGPFTGSPSVNEGLISFFYTAKIYLIYGIIPPLILGIIGIIYFIGRKERQAIIPFFVVLPSFIYLISPYISPDHPWMLRRIVFSILPALIFYSVMLLAVWEKESRHPIKTKLFILVTIILFLSNLPSFLKYLTFSENENLLARTEELSRNFPDNDLILIDRLASGDGWSMISGPMSFLYGKQAVYFFNPADYDKINTEKFDKIYLIAPEENIAFYQNGLLGEKLKNFRDYELKTGRLNTAGEPVKTPEKINVSVKGKIFEITKN